MVMHSNFSAFIDLTTAINLNHTSFPRICKDFRFCIWEIMLMRVRLMRSLCHWGRLFGVLELRSRAAEYE